MSGALVRYEEMRAAVESCARIDEAAEIRDKAKSLEAYARERDDKDLAVWLSEIKLRAVTRIGELVRELEKAEPGPAPEDTSHRREVTPKAKALSEAGLSTSTANRYEQIAGGRDERAQAAGKAAAEVYFAKARATRTPGTVEGLRAAVKEAVVATVGSPKPRAPRAEIAPDPLSRPWIEWITAVQHISKGRGEMRALAERVPASGADLLAEARLASENLAKWLQELESLYEPKAA